MRISDWSSDVCSSDLLAPRKPGASPTISRRASTDPKLDTGALWKAGNAARLACRNAARRGQCGQSRSGAAGSTRSVTLMRARRPDRKRVVSGKSVSVRVDLGGRRIIKKKKQQNIDKHDYCY